MSQQDLSLQYTEVGYELGVPTSDPVARLTGRVTVQQLSCAADSGRGSLLYSAVASGKPVNNAAAVSLFALSALRMVDFMQRNQEDLSPTRLTLTELQRTLNTLVTTFTVESTSGAIPQVLEVGID